ncbi:hypothetical protein OHY99_05420 [Serratia marcescens]|uniref:hypothetical protein n=1 Tax=Serratia marcescens TaxID=615 RepID=UPI00221FCDC1|nr:hypothetical protein [Serratia marcescens]UYU05082.1 hypothetical protein OHY99_05420 [Serratia marcescens]
MDKQYEESRNQFEKYFEDFHGYHPSDSHDQSHVENIWHTWQHSRASIVVELPDLERYYAGKAAHTRVYSAHAFRNDVEKNLRSIGLSIKGE